MPAAATGTGIHWQVAQATSLQNIVFYMSTASGNAHQGVSIVWPFGVEMTGFRYMDGKWEVGCCLSQPCLILIIQWRLYGRFDLQWR